MSALANTQARERDSRVAALSLTPAEEEAKGLLHDVALIDRVRWPDVADHVTRSDIIHAHVWQAPEIFEFLRLPLPGRLVIWFHVASRAAPQRIPAAILDQADIVILSASASIASKPFSMAAMRLETIVPTRDVTEFLALERRPSAKIVCGHVGSLDPLRLPEDILTCYTDPRLHGVHFDFAGVGPLLGSLRDQSRHLGLQERARFHGQVKDIGKFLQNCDIFGGPQGPFSYASSDMSIEEAMAAGLPCVLLSPEGESDLVDNETTGFIADTIEGYVASLAKLAGDAGLRMLMGSRAREHAASAFRPERTAASFRAVYERALDQARTSRRDLRADPTKQSFLSAGTEALIFALGDDFPEFLGSAHASTEAEAGIADEAVAALDQRIWNTTQGGIRHYQSRHPRDPWLAFWSGLGYLRGGAPVRAMLDFRKAADLGLPKSRIARFEKEALARSRS
jgi:glycosyltransferase involved in cell wall biosynthesis